MEAQTRRLRTLHDQENVYVSKAKANVVPTKKQGLAVRGALGDLNTNVQVQRDNNVGKVAVTAAVFEKKATLCRGAPKSNYSHVQSKVDTGLPAKNIIKPSSRPSLRREDSTTGLAGRAVARSKAALKETTKSTDIKESINIYIQTKKNEARKIIKLPTAKETRAINVVKPMLKESTESLGKLKIDSQPTSLIDYSRLQVSTTQPRPWPIPVVPDDIEDIDEKDNGSPMLASIYVKDIYKYLIELEEKYPVEPDYLKSQIVVTGKMRATLIDWLVEVQRQFTLLPETFHLTVGIIDRYLQAMPSIQRNQLQLVGVTAMFIASKYEEIYAPDVGDFVFVTDQAYSKKDIFQCERKILSKLGFCLARPIPLSFSRRFVKVAQGTSKNHNLAKYFVDLSLIEYSMVHYRPSELAAAAICLSLYLLSSKPLEKAWTPPLAYYSGYTFEHINPIIRKMAKIVVRVDDSKHKAVYNKYLSPTAGRVAELPQLSSETLYELAQ